MQTISVPYWLPSMPATGAALRVYMVLSALGAGREWTAASLRQLSDLTSCGPTTIGEAVRSMEALGVLRRRATVQEHGGRGPTEYWIETGDLPRPPALEDFPFPIGETDQ